MDTCMYMLIHCTTVLNVVRRICTISSFFPVQCFVVLVNCWWPRWWLLKALMISHWLAMSSLGSSGSVGRAGTYEPQGQWLNSQFLWAIYQGVLGKSLNKWISSLLLPSIMMRKMTAFLIEVITCFLCCVKFCQLSVCVRTFLTIIHNNDSEL